MNQIVSKIIHVLLLSVAISLDLKRQTVFNQAWIKILFQMKISVEDRFL